MKNKELLKYFLGTIVLTSITVFSADHPEKYHILIPIIFGILSVFSTLLLLTLKDK